MPEMLRGSHIFLICKAIEDQTKRNINILHPTVKYTTIKTFTFVTIFISPYVVTV